MRKIKYPLLVSDFDGTLARRDGTIGEKTQRAIAQYISDGGIFAISTGRMPSGILSRARALGLKGILCCGQGSVILDIESGQPIMQGRLSNAISIKICKKMEEMGLHTHAYDFWEYYTNKDDESLKLYEEAVKVRAQRITDRPLWQYIEETGMQPFKFLAMVEPKEAARIMQELSDMQFENCVVTKSASFLVEVCNAAYSKGTSVAFLAKHFSVPLENTICVGDQWNDLPMLQTAGLGLAVANAQEDLKTLATALPCTNDEDAIAYVIENYAYKEENI